MEFLIMIALVFGAMFLMTRSTRKRQKQAMEFRDALQPGVQVMTASGYVGAVVEIDGDLVTLESEEGSRTKWVRAAIAKEYEVVAPVVEAEEPQTAEESSGFAIPDDVSSLIEKPDTQDETSRAIDEKLRDDSSKDDK
ncbi:preprotein translocase subunit YajC [Timonella sp. A28]|uniref:preprotein translocase subunit YajC n=1 Tax=Timonella sp. A28 TaxID=3442640 RepID=UPI003EBAA46F